MKGIIFTELIDLVESRFGLETADTLIETTNLSSRGIYTAVGTYSHSELTLLIARLSQLTNVPVDILMSSFGEHLFRRLTDQYPHFLSDVSDPFDFIQGVDQYIHVEVLKLYPDAELPHFSHQLLSERKLRLEYSSCRAMANLAKGLLIGCSRFFPYPFDVHIESLNAEGNQAVFILEKV